MKFRALVFDHDKMARKMLWTVLDRRGYEVLAFPDPTACPLHKKPSCPCPADQTCADVIISDLKMPGGEGVEFIARQKAKGCRCEHIALTCAKWTDADRARARDLGCRLFAKPLHLRDIYKWLDKVEESIARGRKLAAWPPTSRNPLPTPERGTGTIGSCDARDAFGTPGRG